MLDGPGLPQLLDLRLHCVILLPGSDHGLNSVIEGHRGLLVPGTIRNTVTGYVGIYSSSSSTATMLMFNASRKQRAFALVNATRGKCARTRSCTFIGVASPASQNLRPSAKNACAAARASSGVTEMNSAASSCKPCS